MAEEEPAAKEEPPQIETKCFKSCGQIYYGDCLKEPDGTFVRQGFGRQVITGNTIQGQSVTLGIHEGQWENQQLNGRGTYKWQDGSSYDGDFLEGQMEGVGVFKWPDGSTYSGAWRKGQMHGQGRFESRLDGDFLEGHFHQNCYQEFDGSWINVLNEHRKMERQMLVDGDKRRILVIRCDSPSDLEKTMRRVQEEENLIPFVISDYSVTDSPLYWLESGGAEDTTLQVSDAVLAKRRQHDYKQMVYDKIQTALLTAQTFTVVFGDPNNSTTTGTSTQEQGTGASGFSSPGGLPEEWRLSNLMDEHSFPLELFDLKLFHGRYKADFFLPSEKRSPWLSLGPAQPSQAEAVVAEEVGEAPAAAEEGEETEGKIPTTPQPGFGALKEVPTVYLLRFCVVAQGKIESERGSDAIREDVVRQFGAHLPLHRCAILVLSKESYLPKAEDLHAK